MNTNTARILGVISIGFSIWCSGASAARVCGEGGIGAHGVSPSEDPIENRECAVMGRIYCRIAEDRDDGQDQKYAVSETSKWLSDFGQTGSHTTVNAEATLAKAGTFVYGHKEMLPVSTFYNAIYACGAKLRLATRSTDQQALADRYGEAAMKCQQQFPGKPGAIRNDPLRECLHAAVDQLSAK